MVMPGRCAPAFALEEQWGNHYRGGLTPVCCHGELQPVQEEVERGGKRDAKMTHVEILGYSTILCAVRRAATIARMERGGKRMQK